MPRPRSLAALAAALIFAGGCYHPTKIPAGAAAAAALSPRTSADTALLRHDIAYLASDRLEGRLTGTPGNDSAAAYIARRYTTLHLAAPRATDDTNCIPVGELQRTLEAHKAAGAVRTWVTERNRTSGHIMGTAVMGDDPARSVVDKFCRSHDIPNLFVIDGSVFPTSSGVNITATICANAKRVVSYISENHSNLEVAR